MKPQHQSAVLGRVRTARGQLDGIVRMIESDTYCPQVMKQLAAVQGLLDAANRTVLRNHLETCVATAVREGRSEEIIEELMETLKYDKHALRANLTAADLAGVIAAADANGSDDAEEMTRR